jgi:hypothetical protein
MIDKKPHTSTVYAPDNRTAGCFVLMPFGAEFDQVLDVIRAVAQTCGLGCRRADQVPRAGVVLQTIVDEIEAATIIVADLTGRNANVFYETAVAHIKKDPHQVILLAQNDNDVPFDLRALRYLQYANNPKGRRVLKERLSAFVQQGLEGPTGRLFETIDGKQERTRRIVADCEALERRGATGRMPLEIRTEAGLSCLAISDAELAGTTGQERSYRELLLNERNGVIRLIRQGAQFRAILSPRIDPLRKGLRTTVATSLGSNLEKRYEHLIDALEREEEYLAPSRCHLVMLPPGYSRSVFILGDRILYEGIKAGMSGGFDLTTRITDPGQIAARARAFDSLFDDSTAYTLRLYGTPRRDSAIHVRRAFLKGLKFCYNEFRANARKAARPR